MCSWNVYRSLPVVLIFRLNERLTEETARVEDILAQSQSLHVLVQAFSQSRGVTFESLLGPLLKVSHYTVCEDQ